ncbi:MAG: hypothetical protein U1F46_00170 [Marinagarivorans sp.]
MSIAPSHIADINGYIYFSPKTTGQVGKAIKIHTQLLLDFMLSVDLKTAAGQAVVNDIESLRALANTSVVNIPPPMGGRRDSPPHTAQMSKVHKKVNALAQHVDLKRERPFITNNVRVFYYINQKEGDQHPTVYINELQIRAREFAPGGFYEEQKDYYSRAEIKKIEPQTLQDKTIYLNAAIGGVKKAYDQAKHITKAKKPILFFVDEESSECLATYHARKLNDSAKKLVDKLAQTIQKSATHKAQWYIDGEGAIVLTHALEKVGAQLASHKVTLVNPKGNIPKLVQMLEAKKVELIGNFMQLDGSLPSYPGAIVSLASHGNQLLDKIRALPPSSSAKAHNALHHYMRSGMVDYLGQIVAKPELQKVNNLPSQARQSKQTFLEICQRGRV